MIYNDNGRGGGAARQPRRVQDTHVRVLLSFQRPTFHKLTQTKTCQAAWSAFHLKHVGGSVRRQLAAVGGEAGDAAEAAGVREEALRD